MKALLVVVVALLGVCAAHRMTTPQQVHLSYGSVPSEMVVTWQTRHSASSAVVYGVDVRNMTVKVDGSSHRFTYGNVAGTQYVHRVVLTDLKPYTRYFYQCTSGKTSSPVFTFLSMVEANGNSDVRPHYLIYGDMGRHGGAISLQRLKDALRLIKEVEAGNASAVMHVGDFAYDLHDEGVLRRFEGVNGDEFMRRIEPIAAYVPYMTCPGNHEIAYNFRYASTRTTQNPKDSCLRCSQYINRFNMPLPPTSKQPMDMWWSLDIDLIHFVSYSTEIFFVDPPYGGDEIIARMKAWLDEDLSRANQNRRNVPWVVAFGHRPMYCSNIDGDDCSTPQSIVRAGLEELFFRQGVDIIIEAHEHSYERLWPTFNETVTQFNYSDPKAPVHLISGAAGCNEELGVCVNPMLGPKGDWSAFRDWIVAYGYARAFAANATHFYWEEIRDTDGGILDSIWISQTQHGPFPPLST